MKTREARPLGISICTHLESGRIDSAYALLSPILAERTPFRILDCLGEIIGTGTREGVDMFLERVAEGETVGGWVVIGKALGSQLDRDVEDALEKCRGYIIAADVWHGADALAERVPGPALVKLFTPSLNAIQHWRDDSNPWVRRAIGTAIHFWGKRTRGIREHLPEVVVLLDWIEPLFEERDIKVVKGVGWGLKTLGKYYPRMITRWLSRQLNERHCRPRKLMLKKAMTYLTDEQRIQVTGMKSQ